MDVLEHDKEDLDMPDIDEVLEAPGEAQEVQGS